VPELGVATETYAQALERVIREGLAEDVGAGDVTTLATVPAGTRASGELRLKAPGVLAGLDVFAAVFAALDPAVRVEPLAADGDAFDDVPRDVALVDGPARALLSGERLALNLLQRMSGIATATRRYVDAVAGTGVAILDTRKTVPGLRLLDKRAVAAGGGTNHRMGLHDAILIKDNHIAIAGGHGPAVELARAGAPGLPVEVEARTEQEVADAVNAGADVILLDNMDVPGLRRAVALVDGRARTEASGGITLDTIRAVAETGVDRISVGALTHSVTALDLSLELRT
jgi:nicotinate-nucleotide pyrophosphorylase (carboxylating)